MIPACRRGNHKHPDCGRFEVRGEVQGDVHQAPHPAAPAQPEEGLPARPHIWLHPMHSVHFTCTDDLVWWLFGLHRNNRLLTCVYVSCLMWLYLCYKVTFCRVSEATLSGAWIMGNAFAFTGDLNSALAAAARIFSLLDLCCPGFNVELVPGSHAPHQVAPIEGFFW